TISGIVYEPGNRWENLKNICAAGGGEPVPGGVLGFRWAAPVVSLDTITAADVVGEASLIATASYRDRINTAIPKYTSAA
ncbi:hypothetical protein, partial [Bordetella pertussis]|uniref:hypothetical protein n=1 Tax=Bordetella pertussis TaxID=520 RepID=UPI0030CA1276